MAPLTIGSLAERAGVGVETIRFYERQGLVERPARPRTGYRVYPEEVVKRIRFIKHAQALGFTLDEVAVLLALRVKPGTKCTAVRARAALKMAHVEARIAGLRRIHEALGKLVASCPGRGPIKACTILQALDSADPIVPPAVTRRQKNKGTTPMRSLELTLDGMHCDGCASTIQALLSHEQGVKSVIVSFEKRRASVLYDPKETDSVRLAAAVEKAGFRAAVGRDASS